jgi:hypothetical protein
MSTLVQTLANSLDDRALQQISTSLGTSLLQGFFGRRT